MPTNTKVSYKEFSQKIKSKYPEYKDVDDLVLSKKMIEKYPEYSNTVSFDDAEQVKKKAATTPSANPSTDPLLQNMAKYGQQGSQQDLQQPTQSSVDKEAPEFGEKPKESTPIGIQKPIVEEKKKTPTEAQVDVITSYYMDKGLFDTSGGGIKVPKAPIENTEVALRNKEGDVTVYKDIKEAQSLMTPEQFAEQTPIEASSADKTEGKIYEDIIFPEEEAKALSATKILDYTQDKGVDEIAKDKDALNKEASLLMGKETNLFNDDGSLNQAKLEFVQDYAQDKINNVASFQHEILLREAKQEVEGIPTLARTANVWSSTIFERGLIGGIAIPIGQAFDEVAVRLGMKDEADFRNEKALVEQRQAIADYKNKLIRGISEEDLDKGISELALDGKYVEAATSMLYGIVEQIPNLLIGSKIKGGLALMGVASASSHYQSIRDRVDISEIEKIGQSATLGVADGLLEKIFRTDLDIINNGVVYKGLLDASKSMTKEGTKEGIEEGLVATLEQVANYRNNGKFSLYAIADAISIGTGSGSSTTILAQGVSALNHHVTEKQIKKQQETYNVLSKELLRSDLSVHEKINVRAAMKESLVEIQKLKDVNKKLFSKLSAEDATKLVGIHQEIWDNVSAIKKTKSEEVKAVLTEKVQRLYAEKQAIEQKYTDKTPETPETISENVQNVTEELREYTDDESVTLTVKSLDEIPEPFRDRAERGVKPMYVRKTFLGIPYGKEATKEAEYYKYTATGKELKDYVASTQQKSNQEVTNRVVTSEAVNEPVSGAVKDKRLLRYEELDREIEKLDKEPSRKGFLGKAKDFLLGKNDTYDERSEKQSELAKERNSIWGELDSEFQQTEEGKRKSDEYVEKYNAINQDPEYIRLYKESDSIWEAADGKSENFSKQDKKKLDDIDAKIGSFAEAKNLIADEYRNAVIDFHNKKQQQTLTPKETENAIPLEISGKSLLREEQPQVGLQKVGKGNAKQEGAAKQGKKGGKKEVGASTQTQATQEVAGEKSPVNLAKNLTNEPTASEEKAAEKVGITPKNLRDLYAINRDMFGQNKVKAFASAVIMDKMIGAMAIMKGVSKAKIYATLEFRKGAQTMPDGVKFQLDLMYHGSGSLFDKFDSSKVGTGTKAMRSGWGFYFTKKKGRAEGYAKSLSSPSIKIGESEFKEYSNFSSSEFELLKKIFDETNGSRISFAKGVLNLAQKELDKYNNWKSDFLEKAVLKGELTKEQVGNRDYEIPRYIDDITYVAFKYRQLAKDVLRNGVELNQYPAYVYVTSIAENGKWIDAKKPVDGKLYDMILAQAEKENSPYLEKIKKLKGEDGGRFYGGLLSSFGIAKSSEQEVSEFLMRAGVDGNINYEDTDTEYVVFDENAVSIEEVIKFQKDAIKARGAMMMALDGKAIIYALTDPNVSTPLHELAHVFEHYLTEAQKASVLKWTGATEWSVEVSEKFARGFEKYLADGKAPTVSMQKIFDRFKEWLTDIYNGIKGSEIDVELNDEMKALYGKMLGVDEVVSKKVKDDVVKTIADKLRGTKFVQTYKDLSKLQNDPLGIVKLAWDGAIETAAKTIEVGGTVAQAINDAVAHLKNSEWYKSLKEKGSKSLAVDALKSELDGKLTQIELDVVYKTKEVPKVFRTKEGFRVVKEIAGIINKVVERRAGKNVTYKELLETASQDAKAYLQGTKFYETADDITREEAVRATLRLAEQRVKDAPTVDKVLGKQAADVFKTTINEWYRDLEKLSSESRKELLAVVNKAFKKLPKGLKVSDSTVKAIIRKASNTNTASPQSVADFVDYVRKIFEDSDYRRNVVIAKKLQRGLLSNLKNGGIQDYNGKIREITDQKPEFLEPSELVLFNEYLSKYGTRDRVKDRTTILEDTADIKKMFNDRWNKVSSKTEKVLSEKKADVVIENDALKSIAKEINPTVFGFDFETAEFIKNITDEQLDVLSDKEKADLFVEIQNAVAAQNAGMPSMAFNSAFEDIKRTIESKVKANEINAALEASSGTRSLLRDKFNPFKSKIEKVRNFIRKNPLHDIGRAFYDKNRKLYDSIVLELSERQSAFEQRMDDFFGYTAKSKLSKNPRERAKQNVKMMFIALQKQYLSNPERREYTMSVDEAVEASNEHSKTGKGLDKVLGGNYRKHNEIVNEVYNEFLSENEEGKMVFDLEKAEASLSGIEKSYMEISSSLLEDSRKMEEINARVHGTDFVGFEDYIPHMVVGQSSVSLEDAIRAANNALSVSTESERHISRTKGAKPIIFNYEEAVMRTYKASALDFYMTRPLKALGKALDIVSKGAKTQEVRDYSKAISDVLEEVTQNTFANNMMTNFNNYDKAIALVKKRSYQIALASIPRSVVELLSNLSYVAFYKPIEFVQGAAKVTELFNENVDIQQAATNMKSVHLDRMFSQNMTSKFIEEGAISRVSENAWGRFVDNVSGKIISTPDKMVAVPLWVGSVSRKFKKMTGESLDWSAVAKNDPQYMDKYGEAIRESKKEADKLVIEAAASTNPFEGIVSNQMSSKDTSLKAIGKAYNNLFTRFLIFEFTSVAKGVDALVGSGEMTKREGAAIIAAASSRMVVYQALATNVSGLFMQLLFSMFGDDDEEETKKMAEEINPKTDEGKRNFYRSVASTAISFASRRLGNLGRIPINILSENLNSKYGHKIGLRESEIYKFGEEISYSIYPIDKTIGAKKSTKEKYLSAILTGSAHFQAPLTELINVTDNGIRLWEANKKINEFSEKAYSYVESGDFTKEEAEKSIEAKRSKVLKDNKKTFDALLKSATVIGGTTFGIPMANDIKDITAELVARNFREERRKQEETAKRKLENSKK